MGACPVLPEAPRSEPLRGLEEPGELPRAGGEERGEAALSSEVEGRGHAGPPTYKAASRRHQGGALRAALTWPAPRMTREHPPSPRLAGMAWGPPAFGATTGTDARRARGGFGLTLAARLGMYVLPGRQRVPVPGQPGCPRRDSPAGDVPS